MKGLNRPCHFHFLKAAINAKVVLGPFLNILFAIFLINDIILKLTFVFLWKLQELENTCGDSVYVNDIKVKVEEDIEITGLNTELNEGIVENIDLQIKEERALEVKETDKQTNEGNRLVINWVNNYSYPSVVVSSRSSESVSHLTVSGGSNHILTNGSYSNLSSFKNQMRPHGDQTYTANVNGQSLQKGSMSSTAATTIPVSQHNDALVGRVNCSSTIVTKNSLTKTNNPAPTRTIFLVTGAGNPLNQGVNTSATKTINSLTTGRTITSLTSPTNSQLIIRTISSLTSATSKSLLSGINNSLTCRVDKIVSAPNPYSSHNPSFLSNRITPLRDTNNLNSKGSNSISNRVDFSPTVVQLPHNYNNSWSKSTMTSKSLHWKKLHGSKGTQIPLYCDRCVQVTSFKVNVKV